MTSLGGEGEGRRVVSGQLDLLLVWLWFTHIALLIVVDVDVDLAIYS